MDHDRFDDDPPGAGRRNSPNNQTVCRPVAGAPVPVCSFEELFVQHYSTIRRVCEQTHARGLALFVLQERALVAAGTLLAKAFDINTAVIGRHGFADVFVDGDASLSLRHALVVLHPCRHGEDLRIRVVDLRSSAGFLDERGRSLESVETEGPLFLCCSEQSLMLLPTDLVAPPWPESAHDGWQCIPERVLLRELPPPSGRPRGVGAHPGWAPVAADGRARPSLRQSFIWFFGGPAFAAPSLVAPDEVATAELVVHGPSEVSRMAIGPSALARGVLIGRYERCDGHGLPALASDAISRVHLLVTEVRGAPYAIDLASINGVWCGDQRIRSTPLVSGQALKLADGRVWLEYKLVSPSAGGASDRPEPAPR